MFEHLDDPVPLAPSTREERLATVHRGDSLRRRRRAKSIAAGAAAAALVAAFAWSPVLRDDSAVPPVVALPSATATATAGPGRGTSVFWGSSPEVSATYTMPAGWATEDGWVFKSNADLLFGLVFVDVANVYTDGCTWRLVDPPPGPTVDDLVSAYAKVPGSGAAREVTVDGFAGQQIDHRVPAYDKSACDEGKFGIFNEDGRDDGSPSLWAQTSNQENRIRIVDVAGTRLVIVATYPPKISAKDRTDLDAILDTVQIG